MEDQVRSEVWKKSRFLEVPESHHLADLFICRRDLDIAMTSIARLEEEIAKPADRQDALLIISLWTAAIARYGRCFDKPGSTAKRKWLDESLFRGIDGSADAHNGVMDHRNKYIIHDFNPMTQCRVGIMRDSDQVLGVAVLEMWFMPDRNLIDQLKMIVAIAKQMIDETIASRKSSLLSKARKLTSEQYEKLPEMTVSKPAPEDLPHSRSRFR